jgi:hypothetical protein
MTETKKYVHWWLLYFGTKNISTLIILIMRNFLLLTFGLVVLCACRQNKHSKVTVILFDNQNPNLKVTVDTLLKSKELNFSDTPVDLFFAHQNFHLPYYVPTDGIFKNATKNKECDMKYYPAIVKCYEYDEKKRVVKMTVNGSGTMNNFIYKYNDKNQVMKITDAGTKFILTYNADGTLSELRQSDGVINKKLVFIYE